MKPNTSMVDPDVKIPAAIKAAAARADAAFNATYKKDTPVTPVTAAAPDPVAEPAPAPAPVTAPEPTPAPAPEPTPVTPKVTVDEAGWEHRYNSMKGRHDRLSAQLTQMSGTVNNLQAVIATMQSATPVSPVPGARPAAAERLLTPEEESDYGTDLLNVVGKKAKEELNPELNALKMRIDGLEGRVSNVSGSIVHNAREKMESILDEKCPSWTTINYDDKFKAWLQLPDVYSGAIRHSLLKAAYEQNDTPRVLAFFQGFIADEAATAPAAPGPDPTPAQTAPVKIPLESLAAPGRAKTAAASTPTEKPIFTRLEIAGFYADVRAGKFRGREAEKDAKERQIFSAQNEGRIR